ncbi:YaaA family protein [Micrococcoides hystricis]|uniref:YaaA family protein n=1 Tax=Micrococcoides hystricis TaxID=1572761 RepID=A0ABV6PCB2_9MICC
MKILLPPSEGKTPAAPTHAPTDLDALLFQQLRADRELVMAGLAEVSASADALTRLKVGKSLAGAVEANLDLVDAPAAPAHEVYTGVLFQGLGFAEMSPAEQRWAAENVLVSSGLFGLVRLGDAIPAYRLSMDVNLGVYNGTRIGGLASFWKKRLTELFAEKTSEEVIVDCRSTSYLKSMPTDPDRSVHVDVFNTVGGQLKKISHHAKHYRGILAGKLVAAAAAGDEPATIDQLVSLVAGLFPDYTVEIFAAKKAQEPQTLALILPEEE